MAEAVLERIYYFGQKPLQLLLLSMLELLLFDLLVVEWCVVEIILSLRLVGLKFTLGLTYLGLLLLQLVH